jgi:hypothetical protein
VSIVGGEPLVRYRELNSILPTTGGGATSTHNWSPAAVRPIPSEWARLRRLQIVVSVDGSSPNTISGAPGDYDRVLKHIAGHRITVHCTVTRQQVRR